MIILRNPLRSENCWLWSGNGCDQLSAHVTSIGLGNTKEENEGLKEIIQWGLGVSKSGYTWAGCSEMGYTPIVPGIVSGNERYFMGSRQKQWETVSL